MGKTFTDIAELAEHMTGSPEVGDSVRQYIKSRSVISELIILRASSNLTQRELASRMSCDPSKISKMEAAEDAQLRWGDIAAYCRALGVEPQVLFDTPELPAAYRLREYANSIGELAANMAALLEEEGESELANKTHRFTSEVLFKLLQEKAATAGQSASRAAEPEVQYKGTKRKK